MDADALLLAAASPFLALQDLLVSATEGVCVNPPLTDAVDWIVVPTLLAGIACVTCYNRKPLDQ